MDIKKIIIPSFVILILAIIAYFKLTAKEENPLPQEEIPIEKEFVWIRKDSLSKGLTNMSGGGITVDSPTRNKYRIKYKSKKHLFDEGIDGIATHKKYLVDNEDAKPFMEYKESSNGVEIILEENNGYVYCPVLILDRVLYWKNKEMLKRRN